MNVLTFLAFLVLILVGGFIGFDIAKKGGSFKRLVLVSLRNALFIFIGMFIGGYIWHGNPFYDIFENSIIFCVILLVFLAAGLLAWRIRTERSKG